MTPSMLADVFFSSFDLSTPAPTATEPFPVADSLKFPAPPLIALMPITTTAASSQPLSAGSLSTGSIATPSVLAPATLSGSSLSTGGLPVQIGPNGGAIVNPPLSPSLAYELLGMDPAVGATVSQPPAVTLAISKLQAGESLTLTEAYAALKIDPLTAPPEVGVLVCFNTIRYFMLVVILS